LQHNGAVPGSGSVFCERVPRGFADGRKKHQRSYMDRLPMFIHAPNIV
jgi:hypothetical protein